MALCHDSWGTGPQLVLLVVAQIEYDSAKDDRGYLSMAAAVGSTDRENALQKRQRTRTRMNLASSPLPAPTLVLFEF